MEQRRFEEWKECRSSIGRFDQSLVDIRKFAFSLITGLLTASAFFASSSGLPPIGRELIALAMMLLILGLFTIDRYLEILILSAVKRAQELESELSLELTSAIRRETERAGTDTWGITLYSLFVFASALLPMATAYPPRHEPYLVYAGFFVTEIVLYLYHRQAR
jgi:hypothetical protein